MSDFPVVLTNAVDGAPGIGTPIVAKHLNNLEAKVGVDESADTTSLDYLIKKGAWQRPIIDGLNDPPGDPATGDRYLVGTGTGAWAGKDNYLAQYNGATWDFTAPTDGMFTYIYGWGLICYIESAWTGLDSVFVAHGLATAANDFLVASGEGTFVKKTLEEVKTILSMGMIKVAEVTYSAEQDKTISSALVAGKRYKAILNLTQNTTPGYLAGIFNNDFDANYQFNQIIWHSGAIISGGGYSQILFAFTSISPYLMYNGPPISVEMDFYGSGNYVKARTVSSYVESTAGLFIGVQAEAIYGGSAALNQLAIGTSAGTLTGTVTLYEML